MKYLSSLVIFGFFLVIACDRQISLSHEGLIGAYYGNADFTNIKYPEVIYSLENQWDKFNGHGSAWSGRYEGYLVSPVSGPVTICLESNQETLLAVGEEELIAAEGREKTKSTIRLKKGGQYLVRIAYAHFQGKTGGFRVSWSWPGQPDTLIPPGAIGFSDEQALEWNYIPEPDPSSIKPEQFTRARARFSIVFSEKGRFGGWPANGGIWSWGDEILVAFTNAAYKENLMHHSVDESRPTLSALARSLDGGESWKYEYPEHYPGDGRVLLPPAETVDFTHPGLVIKVSGDVFAVSYDRGHSFEGPYRFPDFGREKLTSRTDYIPVSRDSCLFFLSTEEEEQVQARLQDWAFCVLTPDGGRSFEFLSWINKPKYARSVMPSTVRTGDHTLVTALRRRYDKPFGDSLPKFSSNWIDAFVSFDNGNSWNLLGKVADTDMGKHNGNPPSLCQMNDGRLVLTYGYRAVPYGIRAKISEDRGRSWGEEIHLRDGAREFDMGYTRSVQRKDGKIVTVYYFTTIERKEQYIEACIWDPDDMIRPGQ